MLKADWLISLFEKINQSKSQFFVYSLVCFILGVAIASFLRLPRAVLFYVYLGLLLFLVLTVIFWRQTLRRLIFLGGVFLILGAMRFLISEPSINSNNLRFYNDRAVEVSGFVAEEPSYNEKQAVAVQSEKLRIVSQTEEKIVSGRLIFYAPLYPQYRYGDKISLRCFLVAPQSKNDPTYPERLSRQGVWSICLQPEILSATVGSGSGWKFLFVRLSDILTSQINKILNEPQAAFLDGLLFGSRASIPADLKNYFNQTGTTHIIAVSGYNITIIAGALLVFLRGIYIPRKKAFWVAVLGVIFFVMLTGASASVVRAGIMGIVVLLSKQIGRLSHVGRLLILTAFLMLLANPRLLFFDAGFQLSFAATLGLVYISPLLEGYYGSPSVSEGTSDQIIGGADTARKKPALMPRSWLRGRVNFKKVPKFFGIRDVLLTTVSAIIATTPLILYLFGRFSLAALPANLLILPIIPLTMFLGFGVLFLSAIFFPLGQLAGFLVWLPLTYIIRIVEYLGAFGWSAIDLPKFPWWLMAFIYVIMIIVVYRFSARLKIINEK